MTKLADGYLIVYNASCCIGWSLIWYFSIQCLWEKSFIVFFQQQQQQQQSSVSSLVPSVLFTHAFSSIYHYNDDHVAIILSISQCAAIMEIYHAATGLVRSPAFITSLQVSSRLVALLAITYSSKAQGK
jgi:hypothetical protein